MGSERKMMKSAARKLPFTALRSARKLDTSQKIFNQEMKMLLTCLTYGKCGLCVAVTK